MFTANADFDGNVHIKKKKVAKVKSYNKKSSKLTKLLDRLKYLDNF